MTSVTKGPTEMLQNILRTQFGTLLHVQIRQPRQTLPTRSFKIKSDAALWGRQTETKIDLRELQHSRNSMDHRLLVICYDAFVMNRLGEVSNGTVLR